MTDEQWPSSQGIIRAVRQVLSEFAPGADAEDVEDFVLTLNGCDPDELEVNLGEGFGQFCEDEATCNAAFDRYAELIGATEVISNPSLRPEAES